MADEVEQYFDKNIKLKPTILGRTISLLQTSDDLKGAFRFNLFTYDIEHAKDNTMFSPTAVEGAIVNDNDTSCLRSYLTKGNYFSPSKNNIEDAILDVAMNIRYHPIKDYLEGLRWDGVHRLNGWLPEICGAEVNPYTEAVGRKLFVAAVKRIYEPGCEYHQLVILEGAQGIYKSRLVRAMGGEWYAPIELNVHDRKSLVDSMRGKWILEVEELAGFGRQDIERMKAFLSCPMDRVRLSYGRRSFDFKRQCVLVGTLNPDEGYLADTENRRYWPVDCGDGLIKLDTFVGIRDQLFAEAMVLYKQGESIYLDDKAQVVLAKEEQEKRRTFDPWQNIVMAWLEERIKTAYLREVTTQTILNDCLKIPPERVNSGFSRRVSRILKEAGWKKIQKTFGDRSRVYIPPQVKNEADDVDWTG